MEGAILCETCATMAAKASYPSTAHDGTRVSSFTDGIPRGDITGSRASATSCSEAVRAMHGPSSCSSQSPSPLRLTSAHSGETFMQVRHEALMQLQGRTQPPFVGFVAASPCGLVSLTLIRIGRSAWLIVSLLRRNPELEEGVRHNSL